MPSWLYNTLYLTMIIAAWLEWMRSGHVCMRKITRRMTSGKIRQREKKGAVVVPSKEPKVIRGWTAESSPILSKFAFNAHVIVCNYKPICTPRWVTKKFEKYSHTHLQFGLQIWMKCNHVKQPLFSTDSTNIFRNETTDVWPINFRCHLGATWQ